MNVKGPFIFDVLDFFNFYVTSPNQLEWSFTEPLIWNLKFEISQILILNDFFKNLKIMKFVEMLTFEFF